MAEKNTERKDRNVQKRLLAFDFWLLNTFDGGQSQERVFEIPAEKRSIVSAPSHLGAKVVRIVRLVQGVLAYDTGK